MSRVPLNLGIVHGRIRGGPNACLPELLGDQ